MGEKGVKARYPSPSQFKPRTRWSPRSFPSGGRAHYPALQRHVHGRKANVQPARQPTRHVFEERQQRHHLSPVKSIANNLAHDTVTPARPHPRPQPAPLSPRPEPTRPVVIEGSLEARRQFLYSAADLQYVPRDKQNVELREIPSEGKRAMLYGIPRVTQVYGTIATTTSPQIDTREIDPLHNHSKSNKKHKNYHKYFMEQIRQHGSREGNSREEREERARNRVTHRGRKSPESQSSFASLFMLTNCCLSFR